MTTASNNLLEYAIKIAFVVLLAIIVTHFIGVELPSVANKIAGALQGAGN